VSSWPVADIGIFDSRKHSHDHGFVSSNTNSLGRMFIGALIPALITIISIDRYVGDFM